MTDWENKRLDYGLTVPLGREETLARFRQIARSPEMLRKLEERLDRSGLSASEKRRAIAVVKRMAGIDADDDLAPLADELRRLAAIAADMV